MSMDCPRTRSVVVAAALLIGCPALARAPREAHAAGPQWTTQEDRPSRSRRQTVYRPSRGASKSHSSVKRAFRTIVRGAYWSTAAVYCNGRQVALGTVVDADGHILTKASELNGPALVVLRTGTRLEGQVVGIDGTNDLALLKVSGRRLRPIQWSPSDNPPVGSWIVTPGMGAYPAAIGVVSVCLRSPPRSRWRPPRYGFLGISFGSPDDAALIERVIPNTAAARAGLRPKDVITQVDKTPVRTRQVLLDCLRKRKPGDKIKLRIKRGRREFDVTATLGKWLTGRKLNPQEHMGSELSDRSEGFAKILQHDSVLQARDCGGPALDSSGKAVGINIARAGRVESYVLPHSVIKPVLAKLKAAQPKAPTPKTQPAKPKSPPKPKAAPKKPKTK